MALTERYGRALEHNATVNTAAADKALTRDAMMLRVYLPRAEDMYYVKAKPGETKKLDATELVHIRLLTGRELATAADDPLEIYEWVGQKLLDHIAWQDGEIARLREALARIMEVGVQGNGDVYYSGDAFAECRDIARTCLKETANDHADRHDRL